MTMPGGLRSRLASSLPRDPRLLFLIAVAVLGGGLVLARGATDGVRLLPDSIDYIAAARNLVAGEGLGDLPDGRPYDLWPPLYPVLLAAGGFSVADPHDVAGPLNAIAFGLIVFVAGCWLRTRIRSRFLFVWGCLALALALPLTSIASWAMSEPLFILFALLALIRAEACLRDGGRSSLAWAVVFTALACLTRYMGVAVLVAVAALLLLQRERTPGERLKRAALYAIPAFIPLGLWLARNVLVLGDATVNRRGVDYSPAASLFDLWALAGKWAALVDSDWWGRVAVALLVLAIGAVACVIGKRWWQGSWRPFAVFGGFALVFVVLHVVAMLLGNTWSGVQERHLTPVYIPLLFMPLLLLDALRARAPVTVPFLPRRILPLPRLPWVGAPGGLALALALALSLWIGYGAKLNVDDISRANDPYANPWDYGSAYWEDSQVLRQLVPDASRQVFSNHRLPVYLHKGGFRRYLSLPPRIEKVARVNGDFIVWFHRGEELDHRWDAADLRVLANLETVLEADDGLILRVNREAGDGNRVQAAARYAALTSGPPAARSRFDVYLVDQSLIYARDPCSRNDTAPRFFAHIVPAPGDAVPEAGTRSEFSFTRHGVRLDDACMTVLPLPDYPIASIRTGQYDAAGELWSVNVPVGR